jgi:heterodisulfide reductase subunit C
MKATAHWLELQGHVPKSSSTKFDEEFSEQVLATGRIEEAASSVASSRAPASR